MKAHKNNEVDMKPQHETRLALVEQTISHLSESLIRIERKIDENFSKLDKKIDEGLSKLDGKFIVLENKFERKFEYLSGKIDTNFKWLIGTILTLFVLNGIVPTLIANLSKYLINH